MNRKWSRSAANPKAAAKATPMGRAIEVVDLILKSVTIRIDLLRHDKDGYLLEPGVEYDDVEAVVLPIGTTVDVEAAFIFDDLSEINIHTIAVVK